MKIVLICPSLEPSKSGVGDYVISLAGELARRGHFCLCLAINDTLERTIYSKNELLSIVRLPNRKPWGDRYKEIQEIINQINPDWISLQYVPYGYHHKGVPLCFAYMLCGLVTKAKWHFMFHELWIGISRQSPTKHKVIGFIQRTLVMIMVSRIAPKVVHTTNPLYVYLLSTINVSAERLPLFGNIPVDQSETMWMTAELEALGISPSDRQDWFVVGIFGSIYPDFPLERQILKISSRVQASNKSLAIVGLGNGIGTGDTFEKRIKTILPKAKVRHLGSQSNQRVSAFLSSLDLALPTTPLEFLGKSSAAASMVLHDVPLDLSYQMVFSDFRFLRQSTLPLSELFSTVEGVCDMLLKTLYAIPDRPFAQP
jgi:hypothetical protein